MAEFDFASIDDNIPVINLHGPNALSVYFHKIVNVLIPGYESSEYPGFKRYENRNYPIPDSIRKNANIAVVVMTRTWPKRGKFAHITSEMTNVLRQKCEDYPDCVWEFVKQFCIQKYSEKKHSCIIGLCELESMPFGVDLTPSQITDGALPNFHVWYIKDVILFHTWIGYHSVEGRWHRFNRDRVRREMTHLGQSERSSCQVSTITSDVVTQII